MPKNTTRITKAATGTTRAYRPGDGPSRPDAVTQERSVLGAGDTHRAEYAAEGARGQAAMRSRVAELNRSEGDSGQTGRDAASPRGGVGDYLSRD
jgi:hypothetical protein